MAEDKSLTKWFGDNLAKLLADKINTVYKDFNSEKYIETIKLGSKELGYAKRIELHADALREYLPQSYPEAVKILVDILGEENPNETGMFTNFYWVMPIGKFVEKYGLDNFEVSIQAIEEITKRNTGEYAIRPYIRKYPQKAIKVMQKWSKNNNFHLRRLASEGSRPKLPWSTKLDTFIENPEPVYKILENLIQDEVKFVQKSVANNLTDYLKVNKNAAVQFIKKHQKSDNKNTQWILKHATRKIDV
jgi:3-methyladenine DNA glycosylase AlkC